MNSISFREFLQRVLTGELTEEEFAQLFSEHFGHDHEPDHSHDSTPVPTQDEFQYVEHEPNPSSD